MLRIYTDGACINNGSPKAKAAWGFVVVTHNQVRFSKGERFEGNQTNNVAELIAILMAMNYAIEQGVESAIIFSDSSYSIDSITKWNIEKKVSGKQKKNYDLIKEIQVLYRASKCDFELIWVKGHSGNHFNDAADRVATGAIK